MYKKNNFNMIIDDMNVKCMAQARYKNVGYEKLLVLQQHLVQQQQVGGGQNIALRGRDSTEDQLVTLHTLHLHLPLLHLPPYNAVNVLPGVPHDLEDKES